MGSNTRVVDRRHVAVAHAVPVTQPAMRIDSDELCQEPVERSQLASWFRAATLVVVIWSLSYLIRQPGVATTNAPFSLLGDFALEGMALALAWIALLLAACLAIMSGVAVVRDPSSE